MVFGSVFLMGSYAQHLLGQETPPILNFPPSTYGAENQNWDFAQDKDQNIYVANNAGLLEYNGAKWTLYPSPNNTIIRSVAAVDEIIYTGCFMEFGFWKRNPFGKLGYTSISEKIHSQLIQDEHFWNIESYGHWVLFQSYSRIYIYDTVSKEVDFLTDKDNYYRIFKVNNVIYVYKRKGNIYKIEGGKEKLFVEIPSDLNIDLLLNIFGDENGLTLLTRNQGLFKVEEGKVSKWDMPSAKVLASKKIFGGIRLRDKSFLLGTISEGIIHLDPQGNIINTVNQTNGLSNNTVLDLFEDRKGNVWAALDNGVDCLNMSSYIREYNNLQGTIGTVYASIVHNGELFLGTNQGLFHKPLQSNQDLELVDGTAGQVWALFVQGDDLLCGHTTGTFLIADNKATWVSSLDGTWGFRNIPDRPNWLLQGNYGGMSILEKENGHWKLRNKIKGFEISARFFEILNNREIWVNHDYKGVFKLKPNEGFSSFEEIELVFSLPKGKGSSLLKVEDDLLYAYEKGIFRYMPKERNFVKDSLLGNLIPSDEYISGKLVFDQKKRLWAFTENDIAYAEEGLLEGKAIIRKIPIQNDWRKTTVSFENIGLLNDNQYIIGKTDGYITVDLDKLPNKMHKIYLNGVAVKNSDTLQVAVIIDRDGDFKSKQHSLTFSYSVPRYQKYEDVLFQYRLNGLNQAWSEWSQTSTATFSKLPFGNYTFEVRSKIGDRLSENIANYAFQIARPFYLSNLAVAGYALLLLLLAFITHKSYNRYYKKQHLTMVLENQRKLELQRVHNEQEIMKLKNERLNQEIESKNRELAISTMSMLTRNEVLKGVKKELNMNGPKDNKTVLKLIDKNLNSSKDWDFFKEAFNNSDKDFLKRIKRKHPKLTHNDLKFCAYLRLNLSSKEIAPLLNISVKSIEVRRYRLRKKMELSQNINLTDYILDV